MKEKKQLPWSRVYGFNWGQLEGVGGREEDRGECYNSISFKRNLKKYKKNSKYCSTMLIFWSYWPGRWIRFAFTLIDCKVIMRFPSVKTQHGFFLKKLILNRWRTHSCGQQGEYKGERSIKSKLLITILCAMLPEVSTLISVICYPC